MRRRQRLGKEYSKIPLQDSTIVEKNFPPVNKSQWLVGPVRSFKLNTGSQRNLPKWVNGSYLSNDYTWNSYLLETLETSTTLTPIGDWTHRPNGIKLIIRFQSHRLTDFRVHKVMLAPESRQAPPALFRVDVLSTAAIFFRGVSAMIC